MIQPYWGELDTMGDSLIGKSFLQRNWRRCLQISHRCPWNIGIPKWNKNQYFAHWNNLRFCYQISYRCLWNTEISNWNKNRFSPSEINTVVCITITPQYQRRNNRKLDHNTNFVTIENIIERRTMKSIFVFQRLITVSKGVMSINSIITLALRIWDINHS